MSSESRSTTPFLSFTAGKGYITLSNNLVKQLNIKNGMRIKLLSDPAGQDPRLWVFHLTKSAHYSDEIKRVQSGKTGFAFRINSLDLVNDLTKAFNVGEGKTLRLYVVPLVGPPKNKIEKEESGEPITIYLLEHVPFYKTDQSEQEIEQWLKEHNNRVRRFFNLFGVASNQTYLAPPINPLNLNHTKQITTEEDEHRMFFKAIIAENENLKRENIELKKLLSSLPSEKKEQIGYNNIDVLKITLDEMWNRTELSVRLYNALALSQHHIKTIGDLIKFNKNDLLKIKNFGKKLF